MLRDASDEDGKRAAHQKGRNEQHYGRAKESQREQKRLQAINARICCHVERADGCKTCEREGSCRSDQKFDPRIQSERFGALCAPAINIGTTSGKASHKDSKNCRDRMDRMSEDQPQGLAPSNLVDETGCAGEKETGQNAKEFLTRNRFCFHCL